MKYRSMKKMLKIKKARSVKQKNKRLNRMQMALLNARTKQAEALANGQPELTHFINQIIGGHYDC